LFAEETCTCDILSCATLFLHRLNLVGVVAHKSTHALSCYIYSHRVETGAQCTDVTERLSSFFTARQHIIGYAVGSHLIMHRTIGLTDTIGPI